MSGNGAGLWDGNIVRGPGTVNARAGAGAVPGGHGRFPPGSARRRSAAAAAGKGSGRGRGMIAGPVTTRSDGPGPPHRLRLGRPMPAAWKPPSTANTCPVT